MQVDPDIVNAQTPFWTLFIDGATYSNQTHPIGQITHCFNGNNSYSITLSAPQFGNYTEVIDITNCCQYVQSSHLEFFLSDECCAVFSIKNCPVPIRDWTLDLGDGSQITRSGNNDSDIVSWCYDEDGTYTAVLTYQGGLTATVTVYIENCTPPEECYLSSLCWEEFNHTMECVHTVRLELPDGSVIDVPFVTMNNATNHCNDPYFQNPIPPVIPMVGGYCEMVAQVINAIENLGYSVMYTPDDPLNRPKYNCTKAGYPDVGFFFQSEVKVLALGGGGCLWGTGQSPAFKTFDNTKCN